MASSNKAAETQGMSNTPERPLEGKLKYSTDSDLFCRCQRHLHAIHLDTEMINALKDEIRKFSRLQRSIANKKTFQADRLSSLLKTECGAGVSPPSWLQQDLQKVAAQFVQQAKDHCDATDSLGRFCSGLQAFLMRHQAVMSSVEETSNTGQPSPCPLTSGLVTARPRSPRKTTTEKKAGSSGDSNWLPSPPQNPRSRRQGVAPREVAERAPEEEAVHDFDDFQQACVLLEAVRKPRQELANRMDFIHSQRQSIRNQLSEVLSSMGNIREGDKKLPWTTHCRLEDLKGRLDFLEARREQVDKDAEQALHDLKAFEVRHCEVLEKILALFVSTKSRYDRLLKQSMSVLASLTSFRLPAVNTPPVTSQYSATPQSHNKLPSTPEDSGSSRSERESECDALDTRHNATRDDQIGDGRSLSSSESVTRKASSSLDNPSQSPSGDVRRRRKPDEDDPDEAGVPNRTYDFHCSPELEYRYVSDEKPLLSSQKKTSGSKGHHTAKDDNSNGLENGSLAGVSETPQPSTSSADRSMVWYHTMLDDEENETNNHEPGIARQLLPPESSSETTLSISPNECRHSFVENLYSVERVKDDERKKVEEDKIKSYIHKYLMMYRCSGPHFVHGGSSTRLAGGILETTGRNLDDTAAGLLNITLSADCQRRLKVCTVRPISPNRKPRFGDGHHQTPRSPSSSKRLCRQEVNTTTGLESTGSQRHTESRCRERKLATSGTRVVRDADEHGLDAKDNNNCQNNKSSSCHDDVTCREVKERISCRSRFAEKEKDSRSEQSSKKLISEKSPPSTNGYTLHSGTSDSEEDCDPASCSFQRPIEDADREQCRRTDRSRVAEHTAHRDRSEANNDTVRRRDLVVMDSMACGEPSVSPGTYLDSVVRETRSFFKNEENRDVSESSGSDTDSPSLTTSLSGYSSGQGQTTPSSRRRCSDSSAETSVYENSGNPSDWKVTMYKRVRFSENIQYQQFVSHGVEEEEEECENAKITEVEDGRETGRED